MTSDGAPGESFDPSEPGDGSVRRPSGRSEIEGALLQAADRLFSQRGPADVSLRGIAREANVNHGMVHRYFGTRDDLIDRLLERGARRWTAVAEGTDDFATAIGYIMGPADSAEASAGAWLRLLAWSLLADSPDRSAEASRRYAESLDLLPEMLPELSPPEATTATATALALVFGWRFFHPYIRAALHLDDQPFAPLHEAVLDNLLMLAAAGRSPETT